MTARLRPATALFLLLGALATWIAVHAHYSADLSAFLPKAPTAQQQLLVEQLREGPAARLIIAALAGGDAPARARLSRQMAQALRADPRFASVSNGDASSQAADRRFLFEHRYLLSDAVTPEHFSAQGLHQAIAGSLDALASPEGLLIKPLFAQDPTGELLALLEGFDAGRAPRITAGVWSSRDGQQALLLIQTRASGSDTDAQEAAVQAVRRAFDDARAGSAGVTVTLSGPPVFAVASRALIISEVERLSALSSLLIALLLLFSYRSVSALLLGFVPVAAGALAGVAAVALGFGTVHGITLGFGVTLIGESVDYSIYLFVQGASDRDWRRTLWPTLRLGVLTSLAGFAALLPSNFPGLAQLGLYSVAGLVAAALVTRFVLPDWLPRRLAIRDLEAPGLRLAAALPRLQRLRGVLPVIALAALGILVLHRGALLSRELAALSPVPLADQDLDERLRAQLGAPDVRFMVVASAPDREGALQAAAALGARLQPLVADGTLSGYEMASRYLPAQATQRARLASLPPPGELRARLAVAVKGLPVEAGALEPFVTAVATARRAGPITRADLERTSFATASDALLVQTATGCSALLPVAAAAGDLAPAAIARVRAALAGNAQGAELLDLKGETDRLYSDYLRQAILLSTLGCATILVLLLAALRSARRVLGVVVPLALAVLTVAAGLVALGHALTILHLVGMLLIVAVGSNYALFFDRAGHGAGRRATALTLTSLLIANCATVLAFGVLASARVPLLSDLGSAVAPGTFLALLFAAMLSRPAAAARETS